MGSFAIGNHELRHGALALKPRTAEGANKYGVQEKSKR
jgi:hypothetical protein